MELDGFVISPSRKKGGALLSVEVAAHPPPFGSEPLVIEDRRPALERQRTLRAVQAGRRVAPRLSPRERCRRFTQSIRWQSGQLLAAIIDLTMLIYELNGGLVAVIQTTTILVLLIYSCDLALRAYTYRGMLLRNPWAWFDYSVISFSILMWLLETIVKANAQVTSAQDVSAGLRGLIVFLRWVRSIRIFFLLMRQVKAGQHAARQQTGENKKRYIDLDKGFDLDLVYVSPQLIAMSVPATWPTSLYRNPLREVVRFFESRHGVGGYLVVNCCPELPYPHEAFTSGAVIAFDVQDHTPPTMAQFVAFLNRAVHMSESSTLAIHCRGGKGRSGSMVCAWLLFTRECEDAEDALTLFALQRTELGLGRRKLQGVDTPSQKRYVHQLEKLLRTQQVYHPRAVAMAAADGRSPPTPLPSEMAVALQILNGSDPPPSIPKMVELQPPPRPMVHLTRLELNNWFRHKLPSYNLVVAVHTELKQGTHQDPRHTILTYDGGKAPHGARAGPCYVTYWSPPVRVPLPPKGGGGGAPATAPPELLTFDLNVSVQGDVRVSVFDLDKLLKDRRKRAASGKDPTLPFDHAPPSSWATLGEEAWMAERVKASGVQPLGAASGASSGGGRIIAGKEAGCLFYFLFHSAFVEDDLLRVPLPMMDKAFKNKKGIYRPDGVTVLRFQPDGAAPADAV